jgi:hypothetical protein
MAGLKPGQPAYVMFRSEPGKRYAGQVARLGREADRETREFIVDVRLAALPHTWTIGQRAEVFVETGQKVGVPLIPLEFVSWQGNKPGVFVLDRGKARWQQITLGLQGDRQVEVVDGVSVGDGVLRVAQGQKQTLTNGQRVKAK